MIEKKPWWSDELERLKTRRVEAHENWVKTKVLVYKQQLKHIRTEFKSLERKVKGIYELRLRQELITKFYEGNKNKYWKELANRENKASTVEVEQKELIEYYTSLFNDPPENYDIEKQRVYNKDLEEQLAFFNGKVGKEKVSQDKIYEIMGELRNNKKAGFNGLENELYKYGRETKLTSIITRLIEKYINMGIMLSNLNVGLVCPIIKDENGSQTDKENTRPITISETIASIYERYILSRLIETNSIHPNQCGFKTNSSTNHAIYMIREGMRLTKKEKKDTYIVVYDYSKAFDKVERVRMLLTMRKKMTPFEWLSLVNYYRGSVMIIFTKKLGTPLK